MLHDGRKQEPGHEKALVMLNSCWIISEQDKVRSHPQSEEAGGLEKAEDRKVLFGVKV